MSRNNNNSNDNEEVYDDDLRDLNDAEVEKLLQGDDQDELEEIRKRIKELDEVENQTTGTDSEMTAEDGGAADSRSIWVGNVDYGSTARELEAHFESCGTIARISILLNKFTSQPKGFAYVEFENESSVEPAVLFNGSLFRGRALQVLPKRTNLPGISTTNRPPYRPNHYRPSRGRYMPRGYVQRGFKAPRRSRRTFGYAPY